MPSPDLRRFSPARVWCALVSALLMLAARLPAQVPSGGQLPSPEQAQELLQNPQVIDQLRQRLEQSGLTPDQVHSRLRAAGYPENLLDDYIQGADTTRPAQFGPRTLDAVKALGVLSQAEVDSLGRVDSLGAMSDSLRAVLDSVQQIGRASCRE